MMINDDQCNDHKIISIEPYSRYTMINDGDWFLLSSAQTNIPALFSLTNRAVPSSGLILEPFYIWVEEEGESEQQEESQDHALTLLQEYKAREALQQVQLGDKAGKRGSSGDEAEKCWREC